MKIKNIGMYIGRGFPALLLLASLWCGLYIFFDTFFASHNIVFTFVDLSFEDLHELLWILGFVFLITPYIVGALSLIFYTWFFERPSPTRFFICASIMFCLLLVVLILAHIKILIFHVSPKGSVAAMYTLFPFSPLRGYATGYALLATVTLMFIIICLLYTFAWLNDSGLPFTQSRVCHMLVWICLVWYVCNYILIIIWLFFAWNLVFAEHT